MTTVERDRTTPTDAAEIMPFGSWEHARDNVQVVEPEALFRFPAPDDPAPGTARLLGMSLFAAVLGLAGLGVGLRAMVTVIGGVGFWYVPVLTLLGLVSVGLAVGSFLSIHRPALPWVLLVGATGPLAIDIVIAALV